MNKDLTYLALITDRSGSMQKCRDDMQGGINTLLQEQAKQPGECLTTMVQFDVEYEVLWANLPIADVPVYELVPRGGTALLDAIGRTINMLGAQLSVLPEERRPGAVIVAITTDGEENSSREYRLEQIRQMIRHQTEKYSWLFLYLGANQDAISVGASLGVARGQTMTFDTANAQSTYSTLSANTSLYRGAVGQGVPAAEAFDYAAFTEEQRDEAVAPKTTSKAKQSPTSRKASTR